MEKELLYNLERHINNYSRLENDFGTYSKMYRWTTENISGFLTNYDLKDKKILTVAGSGDQRLNAYLMGASKVTCFDINPLTELQLNLKDKALIHTNYENYIKFFGLKDAPSIFFDTKIFEDIKKYLDEDTYEFFNYLIYNKHNLKYEDIYYDADHNLETLIKFNKYLEKEYYLKLKEILTNQNIEFINTDIKYLPDKIKGEKYDLILLSNISDYIHEMWKDNPYSSYRELIDELKNNLTLYGTMQVGYIYANSLKVPYISRFFENETRQKYFPTDMFHTITVDSHIENNKDKVIIYQKLR
jgi:hypothetical protein